MGRRQQQKAAADDPQQEQPLLLRGAVVDARSGGVFVPVDAADASSDPAEGLFQQSTDSVADVLAGNYSEGIVDEVRDKYGKAEWDRELSSLDPVDDIQTFYDYDFRLPPEDYDAFQAAAKLKLDQLEELKAAPDASTAAKIEARRQLVENKTADELRWMKHKAYYRGIQRIRAGKAADAAEAEAQQQQDASQQPLQQQQQPLLPPGQREQQQQQQQQQYAPHLSEDELLAAVGEPSEWDSGWTATDYSQHPKVLQQLRSAFSAGLGLPAYKTAAQQEAEVQAAWDQAKAAQEAARQQLEGGAAAKEALLKKHMPFQAFTPEHLAQQRRQKVLASHRRTKQQAFWLSLGLAVGSSAYRWLQQRGRGGKRRRGVSGAGQQRQSVASSRRSTRPPTPSGLQMGGIAE